MHCTWCCNLSQFIHIALQYLQNFCLNPYVCLLLYLSPSACCVFYIMQHQILNSKHPYYAGLLMELFDLGILYSFIYYHYNTCIGFAFL